MLLNSKYNITLGCIANRIKMALDKIITKCRTGLHMVFPVCYDRF